jgi:hypothetical protein
MRRAPRQDRNHGEISDAFEAEGLFVVDLSGLGNGKPDLFVCLSGVCIPVEVKDGKRPPSRRVLTADQVDWWMKAKVNPRVVKNTDDVKAVSAMLRVWVESINKGLIDASGRQATRLQT